MSTAESPEPGVPATPPQTDSIEELERWLVEAEAEIAQIRLDIARKKRDAAAHEAIGAIPKDLSTAKGKWSELRDFLQQVSGSRQRD